MALDKGTNPERYIIWVSAIYIVEGKFNEAKKLIADYLEKSSDQVNDKGPAKFLFELQTAIADFYGDRLDRAMDEFARIEKKFPIFAALPQHYLASAHLIKGQVKKALLFYDKRFKWYKKPKHDWGAIVDRVGSIVHIGSLQLRVGELHQALETFRKADALLPEPENWFHRVYNENKKGTLEVLALAYLGLGDISKAKDLEEEINNLIPKDLLEKFPRSIYQPPYFLQGVIALARNQVETAIENFEKIIKLQPGERLADYYRNDALQLDYLARAYELIGDFQKAISIYQKITQLTLGRLDYGDIYAKSFYQMGKLYQQIGEEDKAVEHYNKFINLWKNCDPIFQPMVEDARKRLSELAPGQE
jgi:tetratricopeptide (TPR) repeat protein